MGKELIGPVKDFESKQEDNWEFKVDGDIHMKNFYRAFSQYLEDEYYTSLWGDDRFETFYDEKYHPDGSMEYRIRWRCYYKTDNDHVWYKFDFNWLVLGCKEKQVVINGKKIKIQRAEVEIKCNSFMVVNKDLIKKSKLLNPFANLFFNRWFRHIYEGYKDEMKKRSKDIEEFLKSQLGTVTYTGSNIEFHRKQGFKDPNEP